MARPLKTAPADDMSASPVAAVPPFHPRIVPPSVAKMNDAFLAPTRKLPGVPLNTVPVGAPATPTTSESGPAGRVIERREIGSVVGDPPGRGRPGGQPPGVDEIRVDVIRHAGEVGDQIVH